MRKNLLRYGLAIGLLTSCTSVPSKVPDRDALVDEFLERAYLNQEATQLSSEVTQRQTTKLVPPKSEAEAKGQAISKEIEEALRPESTIPLMKNYMRSQRAETLEQMLVWLRTPLAQRMLALAAQPFDHTAFNSYQVPKNELRYDLIPRLDKATHTSDLAIEDTTERTKQLGLLLMKKGESIPSDYKLDPAIAQFLRTQHLRKQAFIYQKASDEDLKEYVVFLESPLGQTYVATRRNALVAAHSKAQGVMAKLIKGD